MCGNIRKMTPEHFFPKWMRKFVPIKQTTSINYSTGIKNRRDVGTKTVRNICEDCNNVWMSNLQNLAKPHIVPMMTGSTWNSINSDAATAISSWVVMTAMVCEATHPKQIYGVSQDERAAFAKNQTIANGWRVWIGRSAHAPNRGYSHWPWVTYSDTGDRKIPSNLEELIVPVGQCTVMLVGKLIVLAVSGQHPPLRTEILPVWGMLSLWPEVDIASNPPLTEFPAQYHERVLFDVLHGKLVDPLGIAHRPYGMTPIHQTAGLSNKS
jgi:hypothetical protein